tara:strand:- start:4289 stop:5656 length:1368 start_codon:yes stop_codon:yes gene_type:complete
MAFKTFNRALYAKIESGEGTLNAPVDAPDYIETTDPTFSVSSRLFDRNPTRMSITPAPAIVPGTAVSTPSATVEFSFSVEMAGSGATATEPRWGRLLEACGLEKIALDSVGFDAFTGGAVNKPNCLLHAERLSSEDGGSTFSDTHDVGRVVSDTFMSDGTVYFNQGSGGASTHVPADDEKLCGEVTNGVPLLTCTDSVAADVGFAYAPLSSTVLGGANNSSLSIRLVYDATTGAYIEAVGCRGSVEFAMTNGDRVLMNFTFTGRMSNYVTAATATNDNPQTGVTTIPPAFVGVDLGIQDSSYASNSVADYTGSIFSTMNINLGNEMTVRESASAASGYDVAYITGRSPSATFNPDAVHETTFAFWDQFLAGDVTRAKLNVGVDAGNKFMMKMPAMQFTGISDGNRDEVFVYDSTTTLTGGDYGSSIQQSATAAAALSTQTNPRLGTNNEFVLFCL